MLSPSGCEKIDLNWYWNLFQEWYHCQKTSGRIKLFIQVMRKLQIRQRLLNGQSECQIRQIVVRESDGVVVASEHIHIVSPHRTDWKSR